MLYNKSNLLDVDDGIILHGCNAQGVMGSGVALQVKTKYPEAYQTYLEDYSSGNLSLGSISVHYANPELVIVSAITQEFYGRDHSVRYINYGAIASVFAKVRNAFPGWTVHIPKIGAGLGNGDWSIIEEIIDQMHNKVVCHYV